jgi:hypothetical protein
MTAFNKLMKQALKAMESYDREIINNINAREEDDSVKSVLRDEKVKNYEAMLEIKALVGSET